jgi:hypothetical protein
VTSFQFSSNGLIHDVSNESLVRNPSVLIRVPPEDSHGTGVWAFPPLQLHFGDISRYKRDVVNVNKYDALTKSSGEGIWLRYCG